MKKTCVLRNRGASEAGSRREDLSGSQDWSRGCSDQISSLSVTGIHLLSAIFQLFLGRCPSKAQGDSQGWTFEGRGGLLGWEGCGGWGGWAGVMSWEQFASSGLT